MTPTPRPVILRIAGRKQSGKGSTCKFFKALNDTVGRPTEEFAFATPLKRFCVDVLGLREEQAFGTDADKNTPVEHLLWEHFPVPVFDMPDGSVYVHKSGGPHPFRRMPEYSTRRGILMPPPQCGWRLHYFQDTCRIIGDNATWDNAWWPRPKAGPMTGREVLQYWGSEIVRQFYANVWADATIRAILKSETYKQGGVCVVTDLRFPNELEAIQAAGGRTIRLTRCPFPEDQHASETAFDRENFDWTNFDVVFDNEGMDVRCQCLGLIPHLYRFDAIPWGSTAHFEEGAAKAAVA